MIIGSCPHSYGASGLLTPSPVSVPLCVGEVGPRSWYQAHLDPLMAPTATSDVTVSGVTGSNVTLAWAGDVDPDWFLSVLAVTDGRAGLVVEASGGTVVITTQDTFTVSEGIHTK